MARFKFVKIKKILIANRSEIAVRVQATCRALGIKTVAIYTQEDIQASYVLSADEAYQLSQSGIKGYFDQEEILKIAKMAQVNAVHPGYGFLSENAVFAQKVIDAGMIWVGPSPHIIALMGDKIKARCLMEKVAIPVVPGFFVAAVDARSMLQAQEAAKAIGYPVLLKDPLSGGGKAMRCVAADDVFERAWNGVKGESKSLTGSQQMLVEKYLQQTRHVEIQVAGDGHNVIHLYERECSVQRRHQKIIEESPCAFVSKKTLDAMYDVACRIAKTVNYESIGTVEFLVTKDEQFYFLEMNTRLQVEHALTELTVGIDLVALQMHIAECGELGYQQTDISRKGHALECRIYSEDSANNFLPSVGTIHTLRLPHGPFIRHDHDLRAGMVVTSDFDPMLSKVVTFGSTRAYAIKYMQDALQQLLLAGITTNIDFLYALITSDDFVQGNFSTQLLADKNYIKKLLHDFEHTKALGNDKNLSLEACAALGVALVEMLQQQQHGRSANKSIDKQIVRDCWKAQIW